jgi:hypothetical protein
VLYGGGGKALGGFIACKGENRIRLRAVFEVSSKPPEINQD